MHRVQSQPSLVRRSLTQDMHREHRGVKAGDSFHAISHGAGADADLVLGLVLMLVLMMVLTLVLWCCGAGGGGAVAVLWRSFW